MDNKLTSIRAELFSGNLTMKSLIEKYLYNIDQYCHTNAFVHVFEKEAIQLAESLDRRIESGESTGTLAGTVISIKDVIAYEDHPLSAGSRILQGFQSLYSATAVERMLAEDAVIIGITNCDEFGMGSDNTNSVYGPVKNGAHEEYVAGGSSGGAAVSVQTGCCLAALGSDTGGSVRQPASFCDIYGLKPTYGCISRHGLIAYASSFDQIGIMAREPEVISTILRVIAGPDGKDGTLRVPRNGYPADGWDEPTFAGLSNIDSRLDPVIGQAFQKFTVELDTYTPVGFDLLEYVVPVYYVLACAEASSNLARYDGVRYGYRSKNAGSLEEMYVNTRTEGFGDEVKRRILLGSFVLSVGYYDAYFTQAQKVRRLVKDKLDQILADHNFLLLPMTPVPPWKIGEQTDPVSIYMSDIFSVLANLTGLPSLAIPLGTTDNGLSFGYQLIGREWSEFSLLGAAEYLSQKVASPL